MKPLSLPHHPVRRVLLLCALFLGTHFSLSAAEVSGVVTNRATGRMLEGASVSLQGSEHEVVTDSYGHYRIGNLPAGPVTLTVNYTGLDPATVSVTLAEGVSVRQDVALTAEIYSLAEFIVSGEREGNAQAITLQRRSTGIRSMVSADALGSLAGNPADLVMRLPGVEGETTGGDVRAVRIRGLSENLNAITMDGNRLADSGSAGATRDFQFQTINSDVIERIEVVKSPTPDMDADSIGGAVNMVTKSAFDSSPERRIRGSVGAIARLTDNRQGTAIPLNFSLSYSEVFGDRLGVAVNYGRRAHDGLMYRAIAAHQNAPEGTPSFTHTFAYQDRRIRRTRSGGGVKLDYRVSPAVRVYFSGNYSQHDEVARHTEARFASAQRVASLDANGNPIGTNNPIRPGFTDTYTETFPFAPSTVTLSNIKNGKDGQTIHMQTGAVHRYPTVDIDYDIYRSRSRTVYDDNATLALTAPGVGFAVDASRDSTFADVWQTGGPDHTDINSYTGNQYTVTRKKGWDGYLGGQVNVKKRFDTPVPSYLKLGVRQRNQTRDIEDSSYRTTYVGPDGVAGVNPATGINDDNLAQFGRIDREAPDRLKKYAVAPYPEFTNTKNRNYADVYRERPGEFRDDIAYNTRLPLANALNFEEKITAYYLMGNVELGKLHVLAGVRTEHTEVTGEGALVGVTPEEQARRAAWVGPVTPEELARRTTAEYERRQRRVGRYKNVFPGVHFRYEPMRNVVARLSYASNIGRPSIGQLVPQTSVNYENQSISTSNPALKPQYADNFDFFVEYYFEPAGMVSAGVFYKEISDFIFTAGGALIPDGPDNGFNGDYAGYTLTTQYNGGFAKIKGLELAYSQQFQFLPGFWKGFGVFANYTLLDIEGNYGEGGAISPTPTEEIPGFSPEILNFGISYIKDPITVRLHVNYRARFLRTWNANWAARQYDDTKTTLDIKSSYRLNRRLSVYLDVTNLTAAPDFERRTPAGRLRQVQILKPMFLFGINGRL